MNWRDIEWWEYLLMVVSLMMIINIKTILKWFGKNVDENQDGRISWVKEVIPVLFSITTIIVSIIEAVKDGEQISDIKFIFLVVLCIGSTAVASVLEVMNMKTILANIKEPVTNNYQEGTPGI